MKNLILGIVLGAFSVAGINVVIAAHHEKPAYIVVSGDYVDQDGMSPYYEAARPLAAEAGIEILGRADTVGTDQVLEGEWTQPGFVVLEKFPSMQALKDFWYSEEYQAAKALREDALKMNFIIAIEGS